MGQLNGLGFVAIWNAVQPGTEADFDAWHRQEHMPERLAIPGFIRGERWRAREPGGGYFTLYTLENPSVARSAPYLSRLNDPTPWTRRIMAGFRQNSRCAGVFERSLGSLPAAHMVVVRLEAFDGLDADAVAQQIMGIGGVAGCHIGRADAEVSSLETAERQGRTVGEPAGMMLISLVRRPDAQTMDKLAAALADVAPDAMAAFTKELTFP
ncbi:hypothetical protein IC608_15230 [Devosia sp. PTR5]|uniref:Uncharacterized protein n=1 Tax=Devosia oryzisoli TaxID=2774138 RepID=A0A927IUL4_9HYPH|nr:DUF4286 family protein [Devosia oryzisoli]MBD8066826.1 hypothetical protein [Devosia oryzisoli]